MLRCSRQFGLDGISWHREPRVVVLCFSGPDFVLAPYRFFVTYSHYHLRSPLTVSDFGGDINDYDDYDDDIEALIATGYTSPSHSCNIAVGSGLGRRL